MSPRWSHREAGGKASAWDSVWKSVQILFVALMSVVLGKKGSSQSLG
jgi:hypothetical protein